MGARNIAIVALGVVVCWGGRAIAREPADPSAAMGKPFQISDSVKKFCAAGPGIPMCEQTLPMLAAMRAEPRNPQWAAPMEALIGLSMRVAGKEWVQIRALECRSTYCALEYAVNMNDLDHDVDGSEELERLMNPLGGIVAPEVSAESGKSKMVSVLVWQKR